MKFWHAEYDYHGGYGAFDEKQYAVVAETKEVALGLVLMVEPTTKASEWEITEIDSTKACAHFISSRCS